MPKNADETQQLGRSGNGPSEKGPELPRDRLFSLVILDGANAGHEFHIEKWTVIVGRDASVADFVLNDPGASRAHACFEFRGQDFSVEDLESTNGVTVNDKQVSQCNLKHGDKIGIGKTTLQFIVQEKSMAHKIYQIDQV